MPGVARLRERLLSQARLRPGDRILDLGCGTGDFLVLLRACHPEVRATTGLDADPEVLSIARAKLPEETGVEWVEGSADALPFGDGSFDVVFSTLVFHHLSPEEKRGSLSEALRILRPGGELHIADWGRPANRLLAVAFMAVRLFDGLENTRENARGLLPDLMREAGFVDVVVTGTSNLVLGTMVLLRGRRGGEGE